MKAEGWAVVHHGAIDVRTVCPRRTGAIVNWFCVNDVPIFAHQSDDEIERMWVDSNIMRDGAEVVEVLIVAVPR